MFIGREYELSEMNKAYQKSEFQFLIFYGRRRVGKTRLIREFTKDKTVIYHMAIESNSTRNLELLSASIWNVLMPGQGGFPAFSSYHEAFDQIVQIARRQKIVFVIDEYPYLASAERSISSLLQSYIDDQFSETNMMLILCGSSMSFMEHQVLGYQSPLYGRRTGQFKILPMDYITSARFVPAYTAEEKAIVYGFTGGIPKYLELVDDSLTLKENIIELFLKPNGYLHEEPYNLLQQELREPANYNAAIEAIATGSSRLNEIATRTHMETANLSACLRTLISLGIIKKETAITDESNKKKTLYVLADHMFSFWYRYIPANMFMIASEDFEALYDDCIKPTLSSFMGYIFEEMCKQYMQQQNRLGNLPFKIQKMGRWWGNSSVHKREMELDIFGINDTEKKAIFGECKFRTEPIGQEILDKLVDQAQIFRQYPTKYYILFSKAGFKENVRAAELEVSCKLISLEDMYRNELFCNNILEIIIN